MKTIMKLREMARQIQGSPYSPLEHGGKAVQESRFIRTKDHPIVNHITKHIKLHKMLDKNVDMYTTNDHRSKKTLHFSRIVRKSKSLQFPFDHEEQEQVDRVKSDSKIPKGYATDVIYNHFKNSNLPLKSSPTQYEYGHKMWHRLVDRTLSEGHHVYHWDGEHLHQTTQSNKEEHLKNSFGKDVSFENKHMIISKKSLHV